VKQRRLVSSTLCPLGVLLLHGCFSPVIELASCSVACSTEDECPPGFACDGGYCARPGAAAVCVAPAAPDPPMFAGGSSDAGGATSAALDDASGPLPSEAGEAARE
jgi:hypothetical protein